MISRSGKWPTRSRTRGQRTPTGPMAGHDLALWQMAVAHQPLAAIIGRLVGVPTEQGCDLGLDSLRQK